MNYSIAYKLKMNVLISLSRLFGIPIRINGIGYNYPYSVDDIMDD